MIAANGIFLSLLQVFGSQPFIVFYKDTVMIANCHFLKFNFGAVNLMIQVHYLTAISVDVSNSRNVLAAENLLTKHSTLIFGTCVSRV